MDNEIINEFEEFANEDELFAPVDAIIEDLKEFWIEGSFTVSVQNTPQVCNLLSVYNELKKIISGKNVKITYKLNEPFNFMGYIRITGESLVIKNTEKLNTLMRIAANVDVYPLTNGNLQFDFGFYRMSNPIGGDLI